MYCFLMNLVKITPKPPEVELLTLLSKQQDLKFSKLSRSFVCTSRNNGKIA